MSRSRITIDRRALDVLLNGPEIVALKQRAGEKVAERWRHNVDDITFATDESIGVETRGTDVDVVAEGAESAWVFREFGTYSQRADRPGRRALRESGE